VILAVYLEVPADVVYPVEAEADDPQPAYEAGGGDDGDEREPEPHERVDLLVEEVDRQHALHRVRVVAAHPAQLEVAQSHARETRLGRQRPSTEYQVENERDAERVVVGAEEQIEQQQLDEQVHQVDRLHPTTTTSHYNASIALPYPRVV